jgi:hypothetical protein
MMRDNLNRKGFGIMDVGAAHVKAGAGFAYKGFIISMSTVFDNPDVAVFLDDESGAYMYQAASVESAIIWCNQNQDKKY